MIKLNPQVKYYIKQPLPGNYFTNKSTDSLEQDAQTEDLMQNNNIAKKSSDQYQRSINQEPSDLVAKPSSLRKQAAIAHAYNLATSDNNSEYKQKTFEAYKRHMPELIAQHGVTDYDDLVKKSYHALAKETNDQFNSLPIKTTFHEGELNYPSSQHMLRDIHLHHHLSVFSGGDRHEFLHNVDPKNGLNENEKFRAVHDFYGHGIHGNQFGPKGEEVAWEHHKKMFSPLAALAMTAETRGQNSWVNYSGANLPTQQGMESIRKERRDAINSGDADLAHSKSKELQTLGSNWNYAKQSSIVLPPEMNSEHYAGAVPDSIKAATPNLGRYDLNKDKKGLVALARFHNTKSHLSKSGGELDTDGFHRDLTHLIRLHGYSTV